MVNVSSILTMSTNKYNMITTELSKNWYIINSDNTITYLKDL